MARKRKTDEAQEMVQPVHTTRDELEQLIRARYPIIAVTTWDIPLVMDALLSIADQQNKFLLTWSSTRLTRIETQLRGNNDGMSYRLRIADEAVCADAVDVTGKITRTENLGALAEWGLMPPDLEAPGVALQNAINFQVPAKRFINQEQTGPSKAGIFVLFGFENFLNSADIKQMFWDVSQELETQRKTVVLVSPIFQFPPEIAKLITVVNWPLPTRSDMEQLVREYADILSDKLVKPVDLDDDGIKVLGKALAGMTRFEAERSLKKVAVKTGGLDASDLTLSILNEHKKALIAKEGGALEYWDESATNAEIGGLDLLKEYVLEAGVVSEEEIKEFTIGNIASRGVLVGGPPGTGKSLVAKAISGYMRLPLVRLDFGKMFGPLLGQSEANQRQVFDIIKAIAPCVLWLDEMEKGNATGGGETDGGTSARLLGAFLTWAEEVIRENGVFMVGTVNWIDKVDAALQGRFSERFFVDLPGPVAREEIIRIHLNKLGRPDPESMGIDVLSLVEQTRGFSGREIMEAILTAFRRAYLDKRRGVSDDVTHDHLAASFAEVVPLSTQRAADIRKMRAWGQTARRSSTEPFDGLKDDAPTQSVGDAYRNLGRF